MPLETVRSAEQWKRQFTAAGRRAVVAIGNFDGMHRGHQEILRRVVARAKQEDCAAAVLTFYPHPARVLRPSQAPSLLMTLGQRLKAFDAAGIDAVLVMPFDLALAEMSAQNFAQRVLVETMRVRAVLVGENFRFGNRQMGDVALLQDHGRQWDFQVEIVPPVVQDGLVISSSAIRNALAEGRMADAERMLGRPFSLQGEIQAGTGLGSKIVVPTLNLKTEQEMLPRKGVYATETLLRGRAYRSVTNVGMRPTFNGAHLTIESHLFDYAQDQTSGAIEVRFFKHLRDEMKFSGPQELKEQIAKDMSDAAEFFAQHEKEKLYPDLS